MDDGKLGSEISGGDSSSSAWEAFAGESSGYFDRASSSILSEFGWSLPLDPDRIGSDDIRTACVGFGASPLDLMAEEDDRSRSPLSVPPSSRSVYAVSSSSSEEPDAPAPEQEEKPPETTTSPASAAAAA